MQRGPISLIYSFKRRQSIQEDDLFGTVSMKNKLQMIYQVVKTIDEIGGVKQLIFFYKSGERQQRHYATRNRYNSHYQSVVLFV